MAFPLVPVLMLLSSLTGTGMGVKSAHDASEQAEEQEKQARLAGASIPRRRGTANRAAAQTAVGYSPDVLQKMLALYQAMQQTQLPQGWTPQMLPQAYQMVSRTFAGGV